MSPIERIEANKAAFSRAELAAAQYILESPTAVLQQTLTQLAKKSHSSTAAIIRMCQRIGYDGYKEFKFSMSRYLFANPADASMTADTSLSSLDYVANAYIRYLSIMRETLDSDNIHELAAAISSARSITILGINRTGFSAMQLSYRLSKLGIPSRPITDTIVMTDYSMILGEGDLCILFTIRGVGSSNYRDFLQQMRSQGCRIALLTMEPKLNLIRYADDVFVLPRISKDTELSFLDDQAVYFVFIEVLLRELSQYQAEQVPS